MSIEDKIEILERCKNSEAVLEELRDQIRLFNYEVSDNSHAVREMPYGAAMEISILIDLLEDLAEFTHAKKYNSKVRDNLLYLHNYYNE